MSDEKIIRRGEILRLALQCLYESQGPVPPIEVDAYIAESMQFNDYEVGLLSNGRPRWISNYRWASTEFSVAGWITKGEAGWAMTPEGRKVIEENWNGDQIDAFARAAYRTHNNAQKAQRALADPRLEIAASAISVLEPGTWATFEDVASLAGVGADQLKLFLEHKAIEGAHRLLPPDGNASGNGESPSSRERLETEGIDFPDGLANLRLRVTLEDLRERLEELGLLEVPAQRAWLIRGSSVKGHDLIPVWLVQGTASIAATQLRPVDPLIGREQLKPIVEEDYAHASYAARQEKLDEFNAFLSRMQVGDLVATTSQGRLFIGRLTGLATQVVSSDGRSNLRRTVEWLSKNGIEFNELPPEISGRLKSQRDIIDLTLQRELLQHLVDETEDPVSTSALVELELPDATQDLADELNVEIEWLQESVDLLRDRPQLIYYGPPGTGKTYIAQKLARHLAGDNVTLVQFHPSYSYEDFFEGFRPADKGDGNLAFKLKAGPLRRVVDKAVEEPSTPQILIIDEINRGNLAKIFGELYFLLEYRDEQVDLLYASGDDKGFALPKNVFIIGTMNTADRSIALVDAAMRRRFAFESLHPAQEPTRSLLRKWLKSTNRPGENAYLLDALNSQIADPDFKVGPSYFMRKAVYEDGGLERAWRTAIMPLLEEHHFGDGIDVGKRYGLEAIRAKLRPVADDLDHELATDDEHAQTP